jgi:hypothetical protein
MRAVFVLLFGCSCGVSTTETTAIFTTQKSAGGVSTTETTTIHTQTQEDG